jgi:thymidylate synthase (FAD)
MKIVEAGYEILDFDDNALEKIERSARLCYLSEPKGSPENFVRKLIERGHMTPLEHCSITVKFICDRGVLAELTRHRLASFNVESSRYCNYNKKGFTFIKPYFWNYETGVYQKWSNGKKSKYQMWLNAMQYAEATYLDLIADGATPEQARSVLPMSLKTEIIMTCNLREMLHIFNLRCSKYSHPQMRELMLPLLKECYELLPVIFEDIYQRYFTNETK